MSIRILLALIVLTASSAAAAGFGDRGRACYAAAEHGASANQGLKVCSAALRDPRLSVRDRGATLVNRGIIAFRANRLAAAIADYDAALELVPDLAEAAINKGIALVEAGRNAEAVATLTDVLSQAPAPPALAYYTRAMANEALGATRAAYDDYRAAAALAPDWAEPVDQLRRFTVVHGATAVG